MVRNSSIISRNYYINIFNLFYLIKLLKWFELVTLEHMSLEFHKFFWWVSPTRNSSYSLCSSIIIFTFLWWETHLETFEDALKGSTTPKKSSSEGEREETKTEKGGNLASEIRRNNVNTFPDITEEKGECSSHHVRFDFRKISPENSRTGGGETPC